jgi:hypothetical protein
MEWVVRERVGTGGRNDPSIVCTYEQLKKLKLKKKGGGLGSALTI